MGPGAIDDLRAVRCPSWNCTAACHRIWAWSTSHFDSRVRDPRSGDDPMFWRYACVVGAKRLLPRSLFPWRVGEESRGIGEAMRERSGKPTIQRRSFQYHWAVGLAHPMLRGVATSPVTLQFPVHFLCIGEVHWTVSHVHHCPGPESNLNSQSCPSDLPWDLFHESSTRPMPSSGLAGSPTVNP